LPACNRSIFWAVGQTRGAPHHFYTAVCCVLRMSLDRFERRPRSPVLLYAFDLIELNGDDMRRDPLEVRKATLRSMLAKSGLGSRFNEHLEGDGPTVFAHACKMGLEDIVSKPQGLDVSLRPLAGLPQNEEPGGSSSEAASRRGLGEMTEDQV